MGKSFKEILLEKTGEKERPIRTEHIRNIVPLRENFICNIYYLTCDTPNKPSWNFSDNQITELRESKKKRSFAIVFLTAPDYGYLIYDYEIDKYLSDFPIVKGYYKIHESYLRENVHIFRTIDELVCLLSDFRIKNE